MPSPQFVFKRFTPAQAEEITGASVTWQRDLRRRGFLDSFEGHARFDLFRLAELAFYKLLSDRAVGPQAAHEFATFTAQGIAKQALCLPEAYEGTPSAPWGLRSPDELAAKLLVQHSPFHVRRHRAPDLMDTAAVPARFFVIWANGEGTYHRSIEQRAFDAAIEHAPERLSGPVMVLDQLHVAKLLLSRAGEAVVSVDPR